MNRIVLCIVAALVLVNCTRQPALSTFQKKSELMHTLVTVTVVSDSAQKAEAAIDASFAEIKRLEVALSFWTKDSEIAKINASAGVAPVKVSPETLEIARKAGFINKLTEGAFDPTIGPLIRLWDYKARKIPDPLAIEQARKKVGYGKVIIDPDVSTIYLKDKGMSYDTGGIAKGYATDRAVEVLKSKNISAGLVSIAGDIRAFGRRPDGSLWRVGIRDPRSDSEEDLMAIVELENQAVSTSGDYERFFMENGVRYHHIIDPATGMPARGAISLTVIAPEGVITDGLSTGLFVLGPERAMKILEESGYEGIAINEDRKTYMTKSLASRVKWTNPEYAPN